MATSLRRKQAQKRRRDLNEIYDNTTLPIEELRHMLRVLET